ncbi:MAG: thioredoxin [Lachnospiraceae bacterium]|nr:thioredoxin [Lachnospiraceae bacterium]
MVKKITDKEIAEVKAQSVALIDFSAAWCGPCKMLAPVLEDVSDELSDKVAFYNVDVDECPELAESYGVSSIPALVLLKDGEKVDTKVGFAPKDIILSYIKGQL